ncbi:hypothetical protein SAMN05216475_0532 [Pseudomonas synxantha]|uniref:Uncharacterized protein n=1 Tax=Pseudomonas synxantha TaxID=47883 RepID=A0AAX3I202_9PSED|nr:hypothetical protein [Pseudomonas synxantha]KRP53110.1 hypothetical protein TU77_18250 [Pseudomonas synxantha]SDU02354.1 hypothetical protein SAMN05216475_0532 [Pseudomonas synxantha]VTQ92626.1 Uncharacterised protein [Pseudomonas synxantha]
MANRSKKVMLSARIEPYLKAGIELAAVAKNEKIVKLMEQFIEIGLEDLVVDNPFKLMTLEKIDFMFVFKCIWSEDEPTLKLRAGGLGEGFAGSYLSRLAGWVLSDDYFKGEFDLYGDLNGVSLGEKSSAPNVKINIDLVRSEWSMINSYYEFLDSNKPFHPAYSDYKRMVHESKAK